MQRIQESEQNDANFKKNIDAVLLFIAVIVDGADGLYAQGRGGGRGGAATGIRKAAAPIDLTGYWVSVVTEDWRYRMVTPAPGDYQAFR